MTEGRRAGCDIGQYVTVCTITDESFAASFPPVVVRQRRKRSAKEREEREAQALKVREEQIARAFAKAMRDAEIRCWRDEESLRAVGRRFGLSGERIRQICDEVKRG
jgi:hypothetical protein